jgi:predicted nucleotidyltransferase
MVKTAGVADVLREALTPFQGHIETAFIYGSFAKGTENADSDVDVLVIGDLPFSEVVDALASAQEMIRREVNPSVYPADEFISKVSARNHFVNSVITEQKIFLIGDGDVFERLVEKRLVG